jgi:hypothetical protein
MKSIPADEAKLNLEMQSLTSWVRRTPPLTFTLIHTYSLSSLAHFAGSSSDQLRTMFEKTNRFSKVTDEVSPLSLKPRRWELS